jgi:hypothetical protein
MFVNRQEIIQTKDTSLKGYRSAVTILKSNNTPTADLFIPNVTTNITPQMGTNDARSL